MASTETKTCLECGHELHGRIDKKFCNDQCRNAYNNKLNSDSNKTVRNINNILRKNRRILLAMHPEKTPKVSRNDLLARGYNFNYHTNIYKTKTGKTYFFCYEFGYLPLGDDLLALVVREEYVE